MKVTIDELCKSVEPLVKAFSNKPGEGLLLFLEVNSEKDLRKAAIEIAKKVSPENPLPVYVIPGNIKGEHGWPFSRIKKASCIKLEMDGEIVTEIGGVIFPQDRPIVLVIEGFDFLDMRDQRAYSHLVDGEGGNFALHTGSILIAGLFSQNRGKLDVGSLSRGIYIELATESE